ncbi:LysR family transcriptional regulator [Nonomuraea sp. SYSU D8015]|uniref:LysR family transcriptional regulator n=1 Tax=Nonomuraea sp. SYSU D8015 TaxID=2593644 RepID=UPI001660D504|nr:LysR family transcriptional regulator [Nonomuraea sp. SYSU D8015]
MEIRSLQYAVTLAEELHFGRAARRHHIATPPFGRHIRRLERELGSPLFKRTSRRVTLTTEGERFVGRARAILADIEQLAASLRADGGVPYAHEPHRHSGPPRACSCWGGR